jgi:hypothetical protein
MGSGREDAEEAGAEFGAGGTIEEAIEAVAGCETEAADAVDVDVEAEDEDEAALFKIAFNRSAAAFAARIAAIGSAMVRR